jgi:hypothetical protein
VQLTVLVTVPAVLHTMLVVLHVALAHAVLQFSFLVAVIADVEMVAVEPTG